MRALLILPKEGNRVNSTLGQQPCREFLFSITIIKGCLMCSCMGQEGPYQN